MRLLVSVADAADASAALAGGADIIDAKDPTAGALGAVAPAVLREVRAAVGSARPLTAALGDAASEAEIERMAREYAAHGASLVKVGFAAASRASRIAALIRAAVRGAAAGAPECGVVAVAYADQAGTDGVTPAALIDLAAGSGACGVLLDTTDKRGRSLVALVPFQALSAWVVAVHAAGLFAALAGKIAANDLGVVRDTGADVAGVRGAACVGGRAGRVSAARVRTLRRACGGSQPMPLSRGAILPSGRPRSDSPPADIPRDDGRKSCRSVGMTGIRAAFPRDDERKDDPREPVLQREG